MNINFNFQKNIIKERLNKKTYKIKNLHSIINKITERVKRMEEVKKYSIKIMKLALINNDDKLIKKINKDYLKISDRQFKLMLLKNFYLNKLFILINTNMGGCGYDV